MPLSDTKNPRFLTYPLIGSEKNKNRYLYLCKTHDAALLSWIFDKIKFQRQNYFLLTIDKHIDLLHVDYWEDFLHKLENIKERSGKIQLRFLKNNFQQIFAGNDIHFIIAAFELGLLDGCVIISPETQKMMRKIKLEEKYSDYPIFFYRSLSDLFFQDNVKWILRNFDSQQLAILSRIEHSNLIIDIDLDYFVNVFDEDFDKKLNNEGIKKLFREDAVCISISLEENYCNLDNRNNCQKIFKKVMRYFEEINLIREKIEFREVIKNLKYCT